MVHFKLYAALILVLASCDVARCSSAGFTISVVNRNLEEAEAVGDIPAYNLHTRVGETLTFVAQGVVSPRGKDPQAAKPDAGAWQFNNSVFKLVSHDNSQFNETQVVVALQAARCVRRTTRVRFVGNILGYDRQFDVHVKVDN